MARIFYGDVDLVRNQLQNAAIHVLPEAPTNPALAQVYYDISIGAIRVWDGSVWHPLATGGSLDEATSALQVQIDTIEGNLTAEATARIAADSAFQVAMQAEIDARKAADEAKADKATRLIAGDGLTTDGGNDTLGSDIHLKIDRGRGIDVGPNGLTVNLGDGLVWGGTNSDYITLNQGVPDAIDDLEEALAQETAEREEGDQALNAKIDAIQITGFGNAVVTQPKADQWNVTVPAITLSNAYTGPGHDTASINADLNGRGIIPQTGDMYVNNVSGDSFLNNGLPGAGGSEWTPLQSGTDGILSLVPADSSITVTGQAGPNATVKLAQHLQDQIAQGAAGVVQFTAPLANTTSPQTFSHGLGTDDVVVTLKDVSAHEIWADVVIGAVAGQVTVTTVPAVAGKVLITR